ncbi:MAG: ABC transporter permease [OCS116 cluster bacterium]|uniref:Peptide ABC transporter permease n=1 Tax=OCS116 cluster bacterium TaxID=2030921 RepID=A0A2A4Z5Q6_9PROT|nr:ABC transporter permease [OCS116 cluster bacterium]
MSDSVDLDDGSELLDQQLTSDRMVVTSQWSLIWYKFRRHKLAMIGLTVTLLIYLIAATAGFLSPSVPSKFQPKFTYAPPQTIHFFKQNEMGESEYFPHVLGYKTTVNPESFKRSYVIDETQVVPIGMFVKGEKYNFLGMFASETHLFGPIDKKHPFYLIGADRLGRDLLTRTLYGARVSMSIGLVGVALSLVIGVILGGVSGFYGGIMDRVIQRVIEFIRSIPTIPLWLGLATAMPQDWPAIWVYFFILIILSLIGWTEIARVVRGRFLSLRTEDFVMAARLDGVSEMRIILRHMMPSLFSHIIAAVTLAIPNMILAESALSFLGLGLQPPIVSWGVLLQDTQNLRAITQAPWLFVPGICVVVAVLALNFLGDGLRDAADPYS